MLSLNKNKASKFLVILIIAFLNGCDKKPDSSPKDNKASILSLSPKDNNKNIISNQPSKDDNENSSQISSIDNKPKSVSKSLLWEISGNGLK
ncbi:MAG: hypothetical protein GY830_06755 [Bacteroidetes bacterium]|nr:hypothetical protein [Bacteroidota bacterium]